MQLVTASDTAVLTSAIWGTVGSACTRKAASAARAGAGLSLIREILECNTTDEALALLADSGWLAGTMEVVLEKIQYYLDHRSYEQITLGAVLFSNTQGYLGQTRDAADLMEKIRRQGV